MSISNDSLPIIAGIITNTARSMTTVMQYIYTVSDSDFYNINIKDKELLKIVTNLPVSAYLVDYQRHNGCHIDLAQPPMCHAI